MFTGTMFTSGTTPNREKIKRAYTSSKIKPDAYNLGHTCILLI